MLRICLFSLIILAACSSSGGGTECTPGAERVCQCWDGTSGVSRCADDGSAWSACLCGDATVTEIGEVLEPGPEPLFEAAEPAPEVPDVKEIEIDLTADMDGDGVPDYQDNCLNYINPDQQDLDHDGMGDVCDPDDDGDTVRDEDDEAPFDPTWPGLGLPATIYAHTDTELFWWQPGQPPSKVGDFAFDDDWYAGQMTDIALDVDGRLYGVTFDALWRCSAVSAECRFLASLPESFNGFTLVPKGTVYPDKEALIVIANSGTWNRVDLNGTTATIHELGSYDGWMSSGDAFSVKDMGTFASVDQGGTISIDHLVRVDPATGAVLADIGSMGGSGTFYGLAGLYDKVYGFDEGGAIVEVDLTTGHTTDVLPASQGRAWWGAGVSTRSLKNPGGD
jgi:hypothetical protein